MTDVNTQISTSIDSLMYEFEVITNNLANVNTPGFKRHCNAFTQALQQSMAGEEGTYSIEPVEGFDFRQGQLSLTSRPLDFGLHGKGFFSIETADGYLYTRNGSFQVNQNRQIVDNLGRVVAGENGPITIPVDADLSEVSVSNEGTVSANGVSLGRFKIVDFGENEGKLKMAGNSCFAMQEDINPDEATDVVVKHRYKEGSNVQMVEELVDMIMVTRLYQANMNFLSATKENTASLMNVAMV